MTPRPSSDGTPKKARWTTSQKRQAQQKPSMSASDTPRRAPGRAMVSRDDRRPFERDDRRGYERNDRSDRRPYERGQGDDRRGYQRDERGSSRRDDRSAYGRDDRRGAGSYQRDDRRSAGSYQRDDRRPFQRDDRGGRPGFARDDRRGGERDQRGSFSRGDRDDRPGYQRDDRRPGYQRDDRGGAGSYQRDDRRGSQGGERRPYQRDDREQRSGGFRPERPRPDRARPDRPRRDHHAEAMHRSERAPRFDRDERTDRGAAPASRGYERNDRGYDRRQGDDRGFQRRDRDDRGGYGQRDRGFDKGFERGPARGFDRSSRFDEPVLSPEERDAERPEWEPRSDTADTATKGGSAPAEVAEDNGFAALGLATPLVERLAVDGITEPFPIQKAAIPDALAGKDVLGRGQTGSGKTLAFGLPMLHRLSEMPKAEARKPRALVLVPTRELAMQVAEALRPLTLRVGRRIQLVAGGLAYAGQINALDRGVDLLVATPGRLADLRERGAVEFDDVSLVVLDEADHMAEMGFLPEILGILDALPQGGQRLLFSATLDRGIDDLVERYLVDPVTHSTDGAQASVTTMDHHILLIDPMHKKAFTADVANREGRTVVFVRTKLGADRVALQLREQGVFAAALHGGLNQGARNRVLDAFRDGTLPVLVATDVAARGIHVDDVSCVLQADPPADHKDYLHRAGRTARAGDKGVVVTLALPHQRKAMERIAQAAGLDAKPTKVGLGDAVLLEATGAQRPSGEPIPEERIRRLMEGEPRRRPRTGGPRGPRTGGFRGNRGDRGDRQGGYSRGRYASGR